MNGEYTQCPTVKLTYLHDDNQTKLKVKMCELAKKVNFVSLEIHDSKTLNHEFEPRGTDAQIMLYRAHIEQERRLEQKGAKSRVG